MFAWRPRWPLSTVLIGALALGCTGTPAVPTASSPRPKGGKASATKGPTTAPATPATTQPGATPSKPAGSTLPGTSASTPVASASVAVGATATPGGPTPTPTPIGTPTPRPTPTLGPDGGRLLAGGTQAGALDGAWDVASFQGPEFLGVGASGTLLVADTSAGLIRRVTTEGQVTTLAGGGGVGLVDGAALSGGFNQGGCSFAGPVGLVEAPDGTIYIADAGNHAIRRLQAGRVTTVAGNGKAGYADGVASAAQFSNPRGLTRGPDGALYVADTDNHRIRKVTPDGTVTTLAGGSALGFQDGEASAARFNGPSSILLEASGTLIVLEEGSKALRRVTLAGSVTTVAGGVLAGAQDGQGASASFQLPKAFTEESPGVYLVVDQLPPALRRVTAAGVVTTVKTGVTGVAITVVNGRCYAVLLNQPNVRAYALPFVP